CPGWRARLRLVPPQLGCRISSQYQDFCRAGRCRREQRDSSYEPAARCRADETGNPRQSSRSTSSLRKREARACGLLPQPAAPQQFACERQQSLGRAREVWQKLDLEWVALAVPAAAQKLTVPIMR